MFTTLVAIGVVVLQVFILAVIAAWITKIPLLSWLARHSHIILRIIFIGAVVGSLIFEFGFGYEPCLLCWYQRMAIFPIAILLCIADIRKSTLLQRQVIILAALGFAIALFHNYIDIFPGSGIDVCGASTVSCLKRYVYEFSYITIPMMSATVLLAGLLLSFITERYSKNIPVQEK